MLESDDRQREKVVGVIGAISDNTAAMLVGRYTTGPLELFAGYEYIHYGAPSDPQAAFTDIAGNFLCLSAGVQQHQYQQCCLWRERAS